MKKSKGFTMIELLATIIILGLLITIAYTSVRNILNRGNNTYYESQENMIVLAGQDYFADYREKLPDEIGDTASVTLETLINESYIDPVKDDDENDCDFPGSRVFVQKITDRDYQYFVTLVCNRYETTEDTADPVITFNPNKKSSTKSITVKMDVTDNEGVASYRYVIEKDGELYRDSGYLNYNGELTIKLTEKGLYEITGYAIDVNGNKSNKKSGKFSIYEGINCAEVDFSSSAKAETWINKNITLTIKLPDNTYRWELSKSVNGGSYQVLDNYIGASNKKLTINSDGKHKYKLTVYDSDGNSCIATTEEYYLDKTKPTCESSGGSEEWKNTSITLKGTCKDTGGSGCTGNVTKKFTTNTNKTNQSPGTVYDKAGNSTVCPANQTVKIDKTAPSCDSSGGSSNWTNKDVTIKGTCKDTGGSGCVSNASKTYTSNTNKTNQSPGTVKDNAGNIRTCPANQTVKIDKNPPTCQSSGGSTSWKNTTITLKGTCSDTGGSGCTGNVSKPFTSDTNLTNQSPGTVYDRAGNSTVCPANQTVRVDKTAPSCTSGGGKNNWTNQNVTITGVCSDGGSGCTGNASKTYTSNTNTSNASPGIVKDNAGNIKTCPANQTVKIDKTAPSCSNSGGNSSWTNQNVTIKGTCSDSGGSGCRSNASKTYTSNTNTTTASPGTVYDNAGNSAVCKADRTVKIDKSPPTCTSSGGSTSWTTGSRTLKGTCSDTGGSGCTGNVTRKFTDETNVTGQSPGTVYDIAGNSTTCPANQTVRIDKTAPTLTASIDNGFLGQAQLRENGKGKTYSDINLTPPTISFIYSDSGSGINTNSVSASCSATDNLGRKYSLSYSYNKANRTIKLNINTANPIVINASCTISVKDNVGKSSSKTISTKIGNGWYKTGTRQICGQPPSYGYKNNCYNDYYWYYYRQGSKVTGWQKIYWYNPSLPEGADRWYYFYTGSEKAINSCYGRPATELATGWCYNVGGYEGWYYLYEPGGKADKTKGIWHSTGAMFENVTFELYSSTYGWETYIVNASGKCISGRGC
ncbi:MAG TPA: prepilin-type N-terminal cleavage/methylation domain-containing protein [Candidatus Onthousia faecipullorum]|uniref:Prepilin-type N-terminal cleavage/methylation domain-containing protein n=1 Tax=Candidatus Onthousia faecipullorum TaxID=2840887 RepID=A0A9D1GD12_9FIRM|nr:prepilin-type N-terminal cleavage/methylation domain-containing protein [Candidatus Onthousia faecipullorum]